MKLISLLIISIEFTDCTKKAEKVITPASMDPLYSSNSTMMAKIDSNEMDETSYKALIRTFENEFSKRTTVKKVEPGLYYEVLARGTGKKVKLESRVKTRYLSKLIDGSEVNNSFVNNAGDEVEISSMIPAWRTIATMMQEGDRFRIFATSDHAYKHNTDGTFPAHSAFIFEIEIDKVIREDAAKTSTN